MTKTLGFLFEWCGEEYLTLEEIWPDGDAPEEPTVEDVIEKIKAGGGEREVLFGWNISPHLLVDGVEVAK